MGASWTPAQPFGIDQIIQGGTLDLVAQAAALAGQALFVVPIAPTQPSGINAVGVYGPATPFLYNVDWVAVITQAATTSCTLGGSTGFTVTYTSNDTGASVTSVASPLVTSSTNSVGTTINGQTLINPKPGTSVTISFGYTSSGATPMQYALHVRVEPLG